MSQSNLHLNGGAGELPGGEHVPSLQENNEGAFRQFAETFDETVRTKRQETFQQFNELGVRLPGQRACMKAIIQDEVEDMSPDERRGLVDWIFSEGKNVPFFLQKLIKGSLPPREELDYAVGKPLKLDWTACPKKMYMSILACGPSMPLKRRAAERLLEGQYYRSERYPLDEDELDLIALSFPDTFRDLDAMIAAARERRRKRPAAGRDAFDV